MNCTDFEKVFDEQIALCRNILGSKAKEYATDGDRLHNFKLSAGLLRTNQIKSIASLMSKHTVSVYDMANDSADGKTFSLALWNEKITDSINYLLLMKAAVLEDIEKAENVKNVGQR